MPTPNPPDSLLESLLRKARVIAVVGLSTDPEKESHGIARLLRSQGYRVIGVSPNPRLKEVWGEAYPSLLEIPDPVDVADLFLRPEAIPPVVEEVITRKIPLLWMQQGIVHEESAERARKAGITVVQDLCLGTFVRLRNLRPLME